MPRPRLTSKLQKYCWWTKSCTTKDDDYPIIYRVLTIPGGAGFRPSTVVWTFLGKEPFFFWCQTWPAIFLGRASLPLSIGERQLRGKREMKLPNVWIMRCWHRLAAMIFFSGSGGSQALDTRSCWSRSLPTEGCFLASSAVTTSQGLREIGERLDHCLNTSLDTSNHH